MTQKAFELSTSWNNTMNESPLSKKKIYNLDDDIVDVIDSDDGDSDIEFFKQTKKDQVIETVKDLPHAEKETPVISQQNLIIEKDEEISNHLAESSGITAMEVDNQPNIAPTNEMDYVPDYFTPSNDYFDETPATPIKENVSQVKGPSPKKVTKKPEETSAKGKKKAPTKMTSRSQSKNKSSITATTDLDDGNEVNGKQLAGTFVAKETANGKKIKKRVVSFVKSCDLVNLERQNLLAKAYLQISFEDIKLETIRSVEMDVNDDPTEGAQPFAKKDLPKKTQPVSSSSSATTLTVLKPVEAVVDLTKVPESTKHPTAKPSQLNGSSTSRSIEMNGNTGGFDGRNTSNLRVSDQDISRDNRVDSRKNQRNDYYPQQPAPPPSSSRNDDWYSRKSPPRADGYRGDRSDDRWVVDRRPDYGDRAAPYERNRQRSRSRSRSPTRKNPYDNQRPPTFESSRFSVPPASRSDWEEWERRRERESKEHSIISQQREQARIERERERERAERGERSNPRPVPHETSRSSYIDSGRVSNPVSSVTSRVVLDNGKRNEMEEWERRREQESNDHAIAAQKREQARIERERVEKERFEKERKDRERAAEREKVEKERFEKERKEREKAVRQKEAARLEKERAERLEKERIEKDRLEKEKRRKEKEQRERERLEREREEELEKIRLLQEDRIATQIFQQQRRDKAIEDYLGVEDGEVEEELLATPVAKEVQDQEQEDIRVTWE